MFWLKIRNTYINCLHMDNFLPICAITWLLVWLYAGLLRWRIHTCVPLFLGGVFLFAVIIYFRTFFRFSSTFRCTGSCMTLKEEKKEMLERKGQKLCVNSLSPSDIQRWYYLFFLIVTVQNTVSRVTAQKSWPWGSSSSFTITSFIHQKWCEYLQHNNLWYSHQESSKPDLSKSSTHPHIIPQQWRNWY